MRTEQIGDCTLYLGDCMEILPTLSGVDAVVTDPPYGIGYESRMTGMDGGIALPGIVGDHDTSLRDAVVSWLDGRPAVIFGSWKRPRPTGCRMVLTWDKGEHVGMGDLSIPWKPNTEEIYILGNGFKGRRGSSVLQFNAPVTWNNVPRGRVHPHEKPVELMEELVSKIVGETILDPFMGSGTTGLACLRVGRKFIGIECDASHFSNVCRRIEAATALAKCNLFKDEPASVTKQNELEFPS